MAKEVLGVIIGNRDFFPDVLVGEARKDIIKLFGELGIEAVMLSPEETKLGAVEVWQDAKLCGELFKKNADRISGILVCLPNFGDERSVADSIRLSGLQVPILVQASPDDLDQFGLDRRRDAFCGKISVCNSLRQYGLPYTLTHDHTVSILSDGFRNDMKNFLGVCRVCGGLQGMRIGAIGTRPNNFNTTRCSEKLLEDSGISVNTIDLSDVLGRVAKLPGDDSRVAQRLDQIKKYADISNASTEALQRMARFSVVVDDWMDGLGLDATAIQCWDSLQKNFGVNVCTIMCMRSGYCRCSLNVCVATGL
jgi:L-fucose isomerase-like protein